MSQSPPFELRSLCTNSDSGEGVPRPRQPKPETEDRLRRGGAASSGSAAQQKQAQKNHTLSANAPEFVPRIQRQGGQPPHSIHPPGLLLSPGAAEFVPRSDILPVQENIPRNHGSLPQAQQPNVFIEDFGRMNLVGQLDHVAGDITSYLLEEFSRTMMILTTHPANIRDFLSPLCDKLRQARTPEILHHVIEILYDQSIYEPNFRYTGARVCHFLCNELKDHHIFSQFKQQFLRKCQEDYNHQEQLLSSNSEGLNKLCGLTLFMGELFLNVTADASGQAERLEFLPNVLTELASTLLSQPSDTSVKTACQLLKLAGGPTEDAIIKRSPAEIENFKKIFSMLEALQHCPHLSQNIKLLVKSVLDLRQNNWGRPDISSHQGESHHFNSVPTSEFVQSEPVFYNQFGKPITREEAGYPEEEEEESYDGYELTEEEEREFLKFQELCQNEQIHSETANYNHRPETANYNHHPETANYNHHPDAANYSNPGNQHGYRNGYQEPLPAYQTWSTNDSAFAYNGAFTHNYDYSTYNPYPEDEGLTMDDEAEKAYEEFLSSQRGPPMGQG